MDKSEFVKCNIIVREESSLNHARAFVLPFYKMWLESMLDTVTQKDYIRLPWKQFLTYV